MMLQKSFGCKEPNIVYQDRVGAYGIGFNDEGKMPVVMTSLYNGQKGYFLLGGGIDNGETHVNCIKRESLEEAGLRVIPKSLTCVGDYYCYIERIKTYFHAIGYFYFFEIDKVVTKPSEPDHVLVWLSFDEVKEKLFLPHQIWAVEQIYEIHQNTGCNYFRE